MNFGELNIFFMKNMIIFLKMYLFLYIKNMYLVFFLNIKNIVFFKF